MRVHSFAPVPVCKLKFALTDFAASTVTEHVPVPEQLPPLHPVKVEPLAAVAVSVTLVPALNDAEQAVPQSMPEGLLVTVPLPAPDLVTVIVGLPLTVNGLPLLATLPTVTTTFPVVAPVGTVVVITVSDQLVTVAVVPLKVTVPVVVPKPVPVIVTVAPGAPDVGKRDVIVGVGQA